MAHNSSRSSHVNLEDIDVVWFDWDSHLQEYDELQQIITRLIFFYDADQCIQYLHEISHRTVLLIVHDTSGEPVVSRIKHLVNIRTIYILCQSGSIHPKWSSSSSATTTTTYRCVDPASLCHRITMDFQHEQLVFNILPQSPNHSTHHRDLNRQESTFMFEQLLIDILTKMTYSQNDFTRMINFLKEKHKSQPRDIEKIDEFSRNYSANKAIWFYTNYSFLYLTLNHVLRTCDVIGMYKMGIFIQDLHMQIVDVHSYSLATDTLRLCRGVQMPISTFEEKLRGNEGALLSVNEFLSASKNDDVARIFAHRSNKDNAAVVFHINIDPSIAITHSFANIRSLSQFQDEEEYLFTSGSVFRIQSIKKIEEEGVWHVLLVTTADYDKELRSLADFYQSLFQFSHVFVFICILHEMGEYEKAAEISESALSEAEEPEEQYMLHSMLGFAHLTMGHYNKGIQEFEQALEARKRCSINIQDDCLSVMMKAFTLFIHGKVDCALSYLQQVLNQTEPTSTSQIDGLMRTCCHQLMSQLSACQSNFSDSFTHQQEVHRLASQYLPSLHPMVGVHHQYSSELNLLQSNNHQALASLRQSNELFQHALPPNHLLRSYVESMSRLTEKIMTNQPMWTVTDQAISSIASNLPRSNKASPVLQIMRYSIEMEYDTALSFIDEYLTNETDHQQSPNPCIHSIYYCKAACHLAKNEQQNAIESLEKAYQFTSPFLSPTHPQRLNILLQLAAVNAALMNCDEAFKIVERAQEIGFNFSSSMMKDFHDQSLRQIAFFFRCHAMSQEMSGENEEALSWFQKCLKIQLIHLPVDHPKLAETYEQIAATFRKMNDLSEAMINYQKAQNIWKKALSCPQSFNSSDSTLSKYFESQMKMIWEMDMPDEPLVDDLVNGNPAHHSKLVDNYISVAEIFMVQDNFLDAINHYRLALDTQVQHVKAVDLETALIWIGLATPHRLLELYDDALDSLFNALKIFLSMNTTSISDLGTVYKYIGVVFMDKKDYQDALSYFEKCLEIEQMLYEDNDPVLAGTRRYIASALKHRDEFVHTQISLYKTIESQLRQLARLSLEHGDHQEALSHLRHCLDKQLSSLPTDHLDMAETYSLIADTMFGLHRLEDAVKCYEYVLQIQIKYLPCTKTMMIETLTKLADLHLRLHRFDDCLSTYEEALEMQLNSLPSIHIDIARTYKQIGLVEYVIARFDDALADFEQCLKIQMVVLRSNDSDLLDTRSRIIDLCSNLNKTPNTDNV